jgi:hypothetical protein
MCLHQLAVLRRPPVAHPFSQGILPADRPAACKHGRSQLLARVGLAVSLTSVNPHAHVVQDVRCSPTLKYSSSSEPGIRGMVPKTRCTGLKPRTLCKRFLAAHVMTTAYFGLPNHLREDRKLLSSYRVVPLKCSQAVVPTFWDHLQSHIARRAESSASGSCVDLPCRSSACAAIRRSPPSPSPGYHDVT